MHAVETGAPSYSLYQQALGALASLDTDGAREQNASGFNKFDSPIGHALANMPLDEWTDANIRQAHTLLRRYARTQLPTLGYDFATFPEPPTWEDVAHLTDIAPSRSGPGYATISTDGTFAYVAWGGNDPLFARRLNDVKRLVSARWERDTKRWRIPLSIQNTVALGQMLAEYATTELPFAEPDGFRDTISDRIDTAERTLADSSSTTATLDQIDTEGLRAPYKLRPFQIAGIDFASKNRQTIISDDPGLGKQHPVDTKVMTPDGWKEIGTLRPGERVIGRNGRPTTVRGVYPQGARANYHVTTSDGSSVEVGDEHLWTVLYRRGGRTWTELVLTTRDLRERPKIGTLDLAKTTLYLPMLTGAVLFDEQEPLPVDGYTIGALIANGSTTTTSIQVTCGAEDAPYIAAALGVPRDRTRTYGGSTHIPLPGLLPAIRQLGIDTLSREKRIPRVVFTAEPDDRQDVLHGLMDGDGSITPERNRVVYHTTCHGLAEDVRELVEGLGGIASVREYVRSDGKPNDYQVRMRLPEWITPFTLRRKAERYRPGKNARPVRTIKDVTYSRDAESVCIAVDAPDQLYVTEHCIVTHNTLQSLAVVAGKQAYPVLIVCPATLKLNWRREIEMWIRTNPFVQILEGTKPYPVEPGADIVIVNYDLLDAWKSVLATIPWRAIIADEAHALKNREAKRSRAVHDIIKATRPEYRLLLTGTPVLNRPSELWPLLALIGGQEEFGGFMAYAERYCESKQTRFGMDFTGAANLNELNMRLRSSGKLIRRRKEDVLTELPEKTWARVPMTMSGAGLREYARAEDDLWAYLASKGKRYDPDMKGEALLLIGTLRRLMWKAKQKAALGWIDEFLQSGKKLIVFGWHQETIKAIAERYDAPTIMGGMNKQAIEDGKRRFQEDDRCQVIAANIAAGGVGHTLTAASDVCMVEFSWNEATMDQAISRAHRMGQRESVTGWLLTGERANGEPTIDDYIVDTIVSKGSVTNEATNGLGAQSQRAMIERLRILMERQEDADTRGL